MIIEVHRSHEMNGLGYNLKKLHECKAEIIATKWIPKDASGEEIAAILQANVLNRKTDKPFAHLNINPAIEDWENGLTVEQLAEISVEAVEKLFPDVPYLIFIHKDISRWHAHAVCPCITRSGKLISDRFEWNRAMKVSRELEIKYNLERALQHTDERRIERAEPIQYEDGDLARKIGDVIALAKTYTFASIGELDAFLRLYNVTVEQLDNDKKRGLTYSILKDGQRVGRPMIATKIHGASLSAIENCIRKSDSTKHVYLSMKIEKALAVAITFEEFKSELGRLQVRTVERIGKDGTVLGITFVDDENKVIANGSSIKREYSYKNIMKRFSIVATHKPEVPLHNVYQSPEREKEAEPETITAKPSSWFGGLLKVGYIGVTNNPKRRKRK